MKVTDELRKLRQRAGLSMADMAAQLGYKTASGYQRYEDSQQFTKDYFPIPFVHKVLGVLEGLGDPPITFQDMIHLSGITDEMTTEGLFSYAGSLLPVFASRVPIATLETLDQILWPQSLKSAGEVRLALRGTTRFAAAEPGLGSASFCLELTDNSMTNPDGKKHCFKKNDRIICDPSAKVRPSDFVIAVRYADEHAIFRRYKLSGVDNTGNPIIDLIALNSDYPVIQIDSDHPGRIIARVMEHRTTL